MMQDRIKRGLELLDTEARGWENEIDLTILDMGDSDVCILGQLYGTYRDGLEALTLSLSPEEAGFERVAGESTYTELTQTWTEIIRKKRGY